MRGVWKRSYGRATKAPPDERGGNRHARPNVTAPHPDSTRLRRSTTPRAIAALVDTGRRSLSNEGPLKAYYQPKGGLIEKEEGGPPAPLFRVSAIAMAKRDGAPWKPFRRTDPIHLRFTLWPGRRGYFWNRRHWRAEHKADIAPGASRSGHAVAAHPAGARSMAPATDHDED
jgi:hypothetical protein